MKQLLTILLLLPWGLQAQETCDTDYRSPRIHYYVSCPDGSDTRRQADPGQSVRAGSDIWILLLQDGGNAVLAKHAGKDLHYGIRERESTYGPLTRREAVEVLNRWIAHYCHLTEQDRKEGRIGYNTPCYTGIADSPLKVGPDFRSGNSLSLKEGERGWRFIHTGAYSEETGMEMWTSRDFRRAVYYRSGELPGTDRAGHRNYTLLQECDIEDCLPRSRTSGSSPSWESRSTARSKRRSGNCGTEASPNCPMTTRMRRGMNTTANWPACSGAPQIRPRWKATSTACPAWSSCRPTRKTERCTPFRDVCSPTIRPCSRPGGRSTS